MRVCVVLAALVMVCGCQSPSADSVDLQSSVIKRAAYAPETRTLTLYFSNGSVYDYAAVPETVFQSLQSADSAGRFYHDNIRGQYETTVREPAPRAP